jgi:hypothetical protein
MFKLHNWVHELVQAFTFYGGGSGGGGTSETKTQLDPTVKPFVQYGLEQAKGLYESNTPQYYSGQTYIAPSAQTQAALQATQNRALMGSPLLPAAQSNVMDLQTATNAANPMYSNLYNTANTGSDIANNVYSGLATGGITNAANPYNQYTASGQYLSAGNPYFNQALAGAAQGATQNYNDAIRAAQGGASMAGRYGSGASADIQNRAANTLAQTLANKYGELAYGNYAAERGLQEGAIGRMGSLSQADIANQLAGANALTAGGQQTYANRLNAAGGLAGTSAADLSRRLSAGQLAPTLAQADYADIQQLAGVGKTAEDYSKTALQADIDRFNYQQNLPYQKLSQYLQSAYGVPTGQVSTTTQSGGGKIVCSAMNKKYGFGNFRNAIWLKHSATMPNAKTIEKGYHKLFLPVVAFAFSDKQTFARKIVRNISEHIARHRTADLWKEMRGKKRDPLGRLYRAIIEPICYLAGKV